MRTWRNFRCYTTNICFVCSTKKNFFNNFNKKNPDLFNSSILLSTDLISGSSGVSKLVDSSSNTLSEENWDSEENKLFEVALFLIVVVVGNPPENLKKKYFLKRKFSYF